MYQVPEYQPIPIGMGPGDTPFSQLAVSTSDTVRMSYIMDKLVRKGKFMMLVGTAGTGKTSIVKEFLRRYNHATARYSLDYACSVKRKKKGSINNRLSEVLAVSSMCP